ncbi:MAG: bifunctional [glutamine synthetase] adenylyltransferase/[glutamine synthetase]-adenylyl-L-tyrosine phosphorylase [Alphaproteobacteria bacterium]|nr:bifunctional [glutamine synthetase] adenylyltransferase/[glutamine synthetase]-adenylyl-L-tyrosine phosphorylase [Alphaproteobacteria bacterium]
MHFLNGLKQPPPAFDPPRAKETFSELEKAAIRMGGNGLGKAVKRLTKTRGAKALLEGAFGNSPYLAGLALRRPDWLLALFETEPVAGIETIIDDTLALARTAESIDALMAGLREQKARAALLIGLADIGGMFDLEAVTRSLTRFADAALTAALRWLLWEAERAGRYRPPQPEAPERQSGIVILAMGKYGAYELNYSSDIDIIVFFDPSVLPITSEALPQAFCVDLTKKIIRVLQEGTVDGYVFRVDLRLRPDAGATQVAISVEAAEVYYESFGQNWERAAMIKARACSGDLDAGERFLDMLQPFIWRKYLDFAAIEDVHSLKRQIHEKVGHATITVNGHNVKLGRGGIREIEFFVQTQQLILGGRDPGLRDNTTLGAMQALLARNLISAEAARELSEAYVFLRTLEHRIQMVNDQQTHALPKSHAGVQHTARFMGYKSTNTFAADLTQHLTRVTTHYAALFEGAPPLSEEAGSLVFTGVEDDPDTLETLTGLGFERPSDAAATIRSWHHGRLRATRSERAREMLTKLMPLLLKAFGKTSAPDLTLARFHDFLAGLPAGIQFFSLLYNNPRLLDLLAKVLGIAPRLSTYLARNSSVLEAMLEADYLDTLPGVAELDERLAARLAEQDNFEGKLDAARYWAKDQHFRIGLQVLVGNAPADIAGPAYTNLAEIIIRKIQPVAEADVALAHGTVAGGGLAILGMGKLGGNEMTATSDLDLIFVYDHDHRVEQSSGAKPLAVSQYYARLAQRFIAAMSAQTAEGSLYEVDMRLRPSGAAGPVAVRLDTFESYHASEAWTWERMALTRARVLTGPAALRDSLEDIRRRTLCVHRDPRKIVQDMMEMREKLARENPSSDPWNLKHVHGRLIDLEFTAQILQLIHAADEPGILDPNTVHALEKMRAAGVIRPDVGNDLIAIAGLYHNVTQVLRIAVEGAFAPGRAAPALRELLARAAGEPSFEATEVRLRKAQERVLQVFGEIVSRYK